MNRTPVGLGRAASERVALLVIALLLVATLAVPAVGVAEAAVPDERQVGATLSARVHFTDLYHDPALGSWRLVGLTQLTDATWTVTLYDADGNQLGRQSLDGRSFAEDGVALDADVSEVGVRLVGRVPSVADYRYDPPQTFQLASVAVTRPGATPTTLGTWRVHHFTPESAAAADAIDAAAAETDAARAAGATPTEAEASLASAVDAYEREDFALATTLAAAAESQATAAREAATTRRLAVSVGGTAVGVGLIGALVVWYRRRLRPPSKSR